MSIRFCAFWRGDTHSLFNASTFSVLPSTITISPSTFSYNANPHYLTCSCAPFSYHTISFHHFAVQADFVFSHFTLLCFTDVFCFVFNKWKSKLPTGKKILTHFIAILYWGVWELNSPYLQGVCMLSLLTQYFISYASIFVPVIPLYCFTCHYKQYMLHIGDLVVNRTENSLLLSGDSYLKLFCRRLSTPVSPQVEKECLKNR